MDKCKHLSQAHSPKAEKVYKDECTKCFNTNQTEGGINVCLTCFNGGCPQKHSQVHFERTHHPIILNIVKTEKEKQPDEDGPDLDTFMKSAEKEYQYATKAFCLVCNRDVTSELPTFESIKESVINAVSGQIKEQASTFHDFVVECEHTKNLEQIPSPPDIAHKKHCDSCDISESLWLCMTCGELGCARSNWDGSGGNNHGVDHYNRTQHPIVCKLRTITPEGTADIHCYKCDELRLDSSLTSHLKVFKLNVAEQTKTEKSMAELELEYNVEFNWARVTEDGKEAILLYGPGHTGLINLGNSCYMASILQSTMSLPTFKQRYFREQQQHLSTCQVSQPANCFHCQMAKLAHGLFSGDYSKEPSKNKDGEISYAQNGIRPQMFKNVITKDHQEFQGTRQQDAFEFYQHFIQRIEQNERNLGVDPTSLFKFKLQNRLECSECHSVRYRSDKAMEISLPVPYDEEEVIKLNKEWEKTQQENSSSEPIVKKRKFEEETDLHSIKFDECLDLFAKDELIPDTECGTCGKKTSCLKNIRFETFPDILVIHLKRFVYLNWIPQKLRSKINVPYEIELSNLKGTGIQETETQMVEPTSPVPNSAFVETLMGMGFNKNRSEHAVLAVDNAGVEPAANWLFAHMDDAQYDLPVQSKSNDSTKVDGIALTNLMAMGFDAERATHALEETNNDVNRATDWLFSHNEPLPTNNGSSDSIVDTGPPKYSLIAFVTHMGKSTSHGHYVAHVKREGKWVFFNDEKVSQSESPPNDTAYLYFFQREK